MGAVPLVRIAITFGNDKQDKTGDGGNTITVPGAQRERQDPSESFA
jgi:hypothetical protein